MPHQTLRNLLISILSFSLLFYCSIADAFQMKITPRADLTAGLLPDNTVLATIQFWSDNEFCNLDAWNTFTGAESVPGEYTLSEENGRATKLNVKLSGENWQPNRLTGKGVSFKGGVRNTTLILSTQGEQFIDASILAIDLTALCRPETRS